MTKTQKKIPWDGWSKKKKLFWSFAILVIMVGFLVDNSNDKIYNTNQSSNNTKTITKSKSDRTFIALTCAQDEVKDILINDGYSSSNIEFPFTMGGKSEEDVVIKKVKAKNEYNLEKSFFYKCTISNIDTNNETCDAVCAVEEEK